MSFFDLTSSLVKAHSVGTSFMPRCLLLGNIECRAAFSAYRLATAPPKIPNFPQIDKLLSTRCKNAIRLFCVPTDALPHLPEHFLLHQDEHWGDLVSEPKSL